MGYQGSDGQSPNVQGSNSPLPQGGGPSPQGGGPSPQSGGPSPQGAEHTYDTTLLANHLSNYIGQPLINAGISQVNHTGYTNSYVSRIFWHVKNEHSEFFSRSEIDATLRMTIKEKLVDNIRGLNKDYPDNWPSRKSPLMRNFSG